MQSNLKKVSISQWGNKAITLEMLNLDVVLNCAPIYQMGMVHVVDIDGFVMQLGSRNAYIAACRLDKDEPPVKEIHITGMENLSVELNDVTRNVGRSLMHKGLVRTTCVVAAKGAVTGDNNTKDVDQLLYVFDGVLRVIIDDKENWIRAGTMVSIPANAKCVFENREANARMIFECSDYLNEKYNLKPEIKRRHYYGY